MPSALVIRATFGRPKDYKAPPKRYCRQCKASLFASNPSNICAPCNGGRWEEGEAAQDEVAELRAARLVEIGAVAA